MSENTPAVSERRFLKSKQAAERIGVCKRTLIRWSETGVLPRYKIGNTVLWAEDELLRLIQNGRVGGPAQ